MKNILICALFLFGCSESSEELIKENKDLKEQKLALTTDNEKLTQYHTDLQSQIQSRQEKIAALNEEIRIKTAIQQGKAVHYLLRVSISQSHFSLKIGTHIKDAINKEEFDLLVDKESFDRTTIGQDLFKSFRAGSFLMKGTLSNWSLTVVDKRIVVQ